MTSEALAFEHPRLLWAIAVAVLLAVWAAVQLVRLHLALRRLGSGPVVRRLIASFSPRVAGVRVALWGLAAVLLVVAAARPRYGLRETEVSNAGIDIAFVVDASKSMLVKDVAPSRLQGTLLEISGLLDRLAGGRVALVPFAGIPFVQCPLTTDHDVIRTYLSDLKPEDIPVGGTNIGRALTLATEVLTGERERAEAELRDNLVPQFKGSKNKAIVLFSDGEDHEGAALEAAQKAAQQGIRVFAVGVGSAFGDPVPVLGPDGTATGVLKDEQGNPIFSKLNMELLEQVAKATGGKAFRYANKTVAPELFQALDALEKAEYASRFQQLGEDRYQYLLGPALLLLLIETALTARRRRTQPQTVARAGRKAVAVTALLALALPNLALPSPALAVPAWLERENPDIAEGREKIAGKQYGDAIKAFEEARGSRPEHPIIWYDLGLAQAALGMHQDAITSFSRALGGLKDRDASLEADIHYAAGTTQLEWARKLEADRSARTPPPKQAEPEGGAADQAQPPPATEDPLPHYRAAVSSLEQSLLADPSRAATKKNLELARLGAFPPCRSRDKQHEPNDQAGQAVEVKLEPGQRETTLDLRLCPEDRDVFRVDLQPGDRFSAQVKTKADTTPAADPEEAATAKPEIAVQLRDPGGQKVLRGDGPPTQAVDLGKAEVAEKVLIDVRNVAEVETPYDLTVKLLPACARIEDALEPNDAVEAAKPLPIGQPVNGRLCPLNDDHFRADLQAGQGLLLKAKTKVDLGSSAIELTVTGPDGTPLAQGKPGKDGLVARLAAAPVDGSYDVRLRGALDTEADFELQAAILPACGERDDVWEDNDQALQASPLEPAHLAQPLDGLQLCPGDDDWFTVELKAGESLFADLSANVQELPDAAELAGALTVEVWDDKGEVWGQAIGGPVTGSEGIARTVAVLAPPPGKYRVRVTGGGVSGPKFPLPPLPPGSITVSPLPGGGQPPGAQGQPQAPVPMPPPGPPGPALPPAPQALPGAVPGTAPGAAAGAGPGAVPGPGIGAGPGPSGPALTIPHVALPPGTVKPEVDARQARLDLPYSLRLRILPPCPAGNDELEPNDTPATAKPLEVGQEQLMRLCKGDQDWVQVTQKAGQALQVSARYDFSHGAIDLSVLAEDGKTELAKGQLAGPQGARAKQPMEDTPEARKGRTATTGAVVPAPKVDRTVKLRLGAGAEVENFYVLRIEEPPPPSDQQKDQQQQDQDQQKQDEQKQDEQKKDQQEQKDQQKPQEDKKDQPKPEEAERKQLKQQMDRHDHNPTNLEALEALRRSQFKHAEPAKDW